MHHLIINRAMAPSATSKAQQLLQVITLNITNIHKKVIINFTDPINLFTKFVFGNFLGQEEILLMIR